MPPNILSPPPPTLTIGDPQARLSLAHAVKKGYRFVLGQDGEAQIKTPEGATYHVVDFQCDCPDKLHRGGSYEGHCKHEIWISQILPCPMCRGTMALGKFTTCFGEELKRFECAKCGNARDSKLVQDERHRRGVESPPLT